MLISKEIRCHCIGPRLGDRRRAGLLVCCPYDFRRPDWNITQIVEPVVPTLRVAVGSLYDSTRTQMHICRLLIVVVLDKPQSPAPRL